ncbi:MAG: extracellular solute-binding protein [Candidatus Sericytochromatia bacterium]|nr:extracellular solute-binding protein [Candidatus Sericytochromatia bacterium]
MTPSRLLPLTMSVLLSLSACATERSKVISLSLWLDTHERESLFFKGLIARMEKDLPHIRLRLRFMPFEDLKPRFLGQVGETREPDIVYMMNDWVGELAEQQVLRPIAQPLNDILPAAASSMQYQGQNYGVPFVFQTIALLYNRDLIDQPPHHFQELKPRATDSGVYPLIYDQRNFYYHAPWFHACGGQLFDANGRFVLKREPLRRSLQDAYALQQGQIVPAGASYSVMLNLFAAGQSQLMISGPWSMGLLQENKLSYGVAPLPRNSCSETPRSFIGVKGFGVNRLSRHPEAVEEVIAYLTSAESQQQALKALDNLPVHQRVYQQPLEPAQQGFYAQLQHGVPLPNHPMMKDVWQEMNWLLGQVFDGQPLEARLDEALERLQRRAGSYER